MKTITFALLLIPAFSFAQINATTSTGKKVILSEDGTWKYYTAPAPVEVDLSECKYSINEMDQFSEEKKLVTKNEPIGKTSTKARVYLNMRRIGDSYGFQVTSASDLGCIVKGESALIIKFADGEKINLVHVGDTDCGDIKFLSAFAEGFTADFKEQSERIMEKMKTTPIELARMQGSKYYTDITIDDPAIFQKRIPCIEN